MQKNNESSNYTKLKDMLSLHQKEWIHRDSTMWGLIFKYFYATLIVILMPNIASFIKITLPNIQNDVFRVIGIVMSIAFLYISIAYAYRLQAVSKTYRDLLEMLDEPYRRIKIKDMRYGKLFNPSLSYILPTVMFLCLMGLSIALIITE